jgi:hypothetical protein
VKRETVKHTTLRLLVAATPLAGLAEEAAIPPPVTVERYADLIERPPFRRHLSLSDSLVLSGVARLPNGVMVTVWNRATGESFIVSSTPNPQGWRLVEVSENSDLRSVTATIAAADQQMTLRFDPERLTPPKLDNQSKPGRRNEGTLIVEALLRALDPVGARAFETLAPDAQEKFRRSFGEFLAAYPTASDQKRMDFIRRSLSLAFGPEPESDDAGAETPATRTPAPEARPPATDAPAQRTETEESQGEDPSAPQAN